MAVCGTNCRSGSKRSSVRGAWSEAWATSINNQDQYRDFLYGGYLVKREINKKLELAAEVFSHAREGFATPQTQSSTLIDAGGYYHFKSPGLQLLFAYGHSVAGETENYAYLGLYKTWGKDKGKHNDKNDVDKSSGDAMLSARPLRMPF